MSHTTSDRGDQPVLMTEQVEDVTASAEVEEQYEEYYELPESIAKRNRIWSVLSLVSAILSVLLCPFYYVSLPLAILAVVFAIVMRRALGFFERISVVGLIIGIGGIVFSVCSLTVHVTGLWELIFSDK